ncbi:MAG: tetraacyldisaccharide 4'-kinase [Candidatus Poribacteria bacterium]|nr:tetraacyldisaccharide 4'-kinase [Candidatus Poribacteria bacterium]
MRRPSPTPLWLHPLTPLVERIALYRREHPPRNRVALPVPVISVGNLSFGGTGKTPTVGALVEMLTDEGKRVGVVMGGYRAKPPNQGDARGKRLRWAMVSDGEEIYGDVPSSGDEAMMFARRYPSIPVLAGRRKAYVAEMMAQEFELDAILVDDAFQHHRLARNMDIVLLDARHPLERERVMPSGWLRESTEALASADLIVLTHANEAVEMEATKRSLERVAPNIPTVDANHVPHELRDGRTDKSIPLEQLSGESVVAACGIGSPHGFATMLESLGASDVELIAFSDHHFYSETDIDSIARTADGRRVVTTAKDAVKWGDDAPFEYWVLDVRLEWASPKIVRERILALFESGKPSCSLRMDEKGG